MFQGRSRFLLILRAVQFFFTLLIMAITGNIIATAIGHNPSAINFAMFVSVFSMLTLIVVVASYRFGFLSDVVTLVLDGLNVLFFFAGGVALAVALGAHSCSDKNYLKHNKITNGAVNMSKRCHSSQAVTAFIWFNFAFYVATTVLTVLDSGSGP